jgi:hypothetical protein
MFIEDEDIERYISKAKKVIKKKQEAYKNFPSDEKCGYVLDATIEEMIGLILIKSAHHNFEELKTSVPFIKSICRHSNIGVTLYNAFQYKGKAVACRAMIFDKENIRRISKLNCRLMIFSVHALDDDKCTIRFFHRGSLEKLKTK